MKQAVVTIKYDEERLNAVRQYMGKKEVGFEGELHEMLNRLYERYVPQPVREYIDSKGEVPPEVRKAARRQTITNPAGGSEESAPGSR